MKYVDGPTAEVEITIYSNRSSVWELVSNPATPAEFSNELEVARWQDSTQPPGIGSIIEGHNHNPHVGEWDTLSYVSCWEPEECFEWKVGGLDNEFATWRFELRAGSTDATVLHQWCRIGPARSGLSAAIDARPELEEKIVENRMNWHRENMQRNLEGIKARVEASPS